MKPCQPLNEPKRLPGFIEDASSSLSDLVEELAEPLAELMLGSYSDEDWQDSPAIEALARVAAMLEAGDREVPDVILAALREATEAGGR